MQAHVESPGEPVKKFFDPSVWGDGFKTFLILGRLSNLPTVWTNCMAGWFLGGGGSVGGLLWLCMGASLLYTGGMFLNDAFDVEFDRQHRKERPIPTGKVRVGVVWVSGFLLLILGGGMLTKFGAGTTVLTAFLVLAILVYDGIHKIVAFSPVLMGLCRFLLYLCAASAGLDGVTGIAVWSGLVLGLYVVGLSYVARKQSTRGPLKHWPCYLLLAPVFLVLLTHTGEFFGRGLAVSFILIFWVARSLRFSLWTENRNIGRTISGLLAGIVWVDFAALGGGDLGVGATFLALFALTLFLQRFIPAT